MEFQTQGIKISFIESIKKNLVLIVMTPFGIFKFENTLFSKFMSSFLQAHAMSVHKIMQFF